MKSFLEQVAVAREMLGNFSEDQVKIVRECRDEEVRLISDFYEKEDERVWERIKECRRDYMSQAYEDDLLDEMEWDTIYKALEVLATLEAMAVA